MSPESAHLFSKTVKNLIIVQNNIFILQHRSTTFHFLLTKAHIKSFFAYHIDINKTVLVSTSQPISTFWYNNQQQNFILKASLLNFQEYRSCLYDHAMMTGMRAETEVSFFYNVLLLVSYVHMTMTTSYYIHAFIASSIRNQACSFVRTEMMQRNTTKFYLRIHFLPHEQTGNLIRCASPMHCMWSRT